MSNPPKQKGTRGETELVGALAGHGEVYKRTPASTIHDLERVVRHTEASELTEPIEALATRPDHGRWLVTISLEEFVRLTKPWPNRRVRMESKRWKKFVHHTIFNEKFPKDTRSVK